MIKTHHYKATIQWTGNTGTGTSAYIDYERAHTVVIKNKPDILCSSDPAFKGDQTKHHPEDLLLAALSSCHMLWYLHLCSEAGIVVTAYHDHATGTMESSPGGPGRFVAVTFASNGNNK